jgi:hypothetical protein
MVGMGANGMTRGLPKSRAEASFTFVRIWPYRCFENPSTNNEISTSGKNEDFHDASSGGKFVGQKEKNMVNGDVLNTEIDKVKKIW